MIADLQQSVFMLALIAMPVISLAVIARSTWCIYLARKASCIKTIILSAVCILLVLLMLSVDVVVWFSYAVAHTGKDASTDLLVLASTLGPTCLLATAVWFFSSFMEKRMEIRSDPEPVSSNAQGPG